MEREHEGREGREKGEGREKEEREEKSNEKSFLYPWSGRVRQTDWRRRRR